ncbi:MAG: RNA polymerase sigma factor [Gemmatimonadetes bacterium]|nr:RNA polymerase sigma factor [Gemmatimonadota bacterium]
MGPYDREGEPPRRDAGETRAFGRRGTLLRAGGAYRSQLAQYAVSLCGDSDAAADAMQESFVRAFNSLASCRDPARFRSWFMRILTNQCHNQRTRTRTYVALDDVDAAANESADARLTSSEIGRAN